MLCRSCGATVADKAIVCYRCGASTAEPAALSIPSGRPRQTWPLWIVAVVIAVVALWLVCRYWFV